MTSQTANSENFEKHTQPSCQLKRRQTHFKLYWNVTAFISSTFNQSEKLWQLNILLSRMDSLFLSFYRTIYFDYWICSHFLFGLLNFKYLKTVICIILHILYWITCHLLINFVYNWKYQFWDIEDSRRNQHLLYS